MGEPRLIPIAAKVSREDRDALERLAQTEERSLSWLVRRAIKQTLNVAKMSAEKR